MNCPHHNAAKARWRSSALGAGERARGPAGPLMARSGRGRAGERGGAPAGRLAVHRLDAVHDARPRELERAAASLRGQPAAALRVLARSEEHTSELQSPYVIS